LTLTLASVARLPLILALVKTLVALVETTLEASLLMPATRLQPSKLLWPSKVFRHVPKVLR
jgi:hypothetical protein